jgi:hypothetical protein
MPASESTKKAKKKKPKKGQLIIVVMPRGRFAGIPPKKSRNHGLAFADTLVPTIRLSSPNALYSVPEKCLFQYI